MFTGKPQTDFSLDITKLDPPIQAILTAQGLQVFSPENDATFNIVGCVLNYIKKCGDQFLTSSDFYGNNFVGLLFEVLKVVAQRCYAPTKPQKSPTKIFTDRPKSIVDDMDLLLVLRCFVGLIENNKSKIDAWIPPLIKFSIELMAVPQKTGYLEKFLIQVFAMLIYYNPRLTINYLKTSPDLPPGSLNSTFSKFFLSLPTFSNDYEKERILYSLSALLSLTKPEICEIISFESLIKGSLTIVKEILDLRQRNLLQNKKANKSDENSQASDQEGGGVMKKGNVFDWYQSNLKKMEGKDFDDLDMESDSDDSDWDEEEEVMGEGEEFEYDSPLEDWCPVLELKRVLKGQEGKGDGFCEEMMWVMGDGVKGDMLGWFEVAEKQWEEKEKGKVVG
jgi:hypothetical protein